MLTLVLTLAMLLSVMVVGAGAAFSDQDSIGNKEAVDVCSTLNIINGYGDGTFRPNGNVTRAEMCKMICVALNGGKEPTFGSNSAATFNDVANDNWAKPYIEYCVSEGIVGGVGGGRFNPDGNITGTQTAKMLLCILGYDASIAGYVGNDSWEMKINVDASAKHLYDGITGIDASAPLTRDQAAQMIWNALQANEVEYVNTFVPGPGGSLISQATVRDKVVGNNNDYITLLRDKYNAYIDVGTLVSIKGDTLAISMNKNDQIESDHKGTASNPLTSETYTKLTVDYSSLMGEKVKVVTKDGKLNEVLGVFSTDDNTVYNTVVNAVDIDKDKSKIEINGELYSIDSTGINVYVNKVNGTLTSVSGVALTNFENGAISIASGLTANNQSADAIKLIDSKADGKIDTAIITQVSIGEVGYVSSEKVIVGTTTYEVADNNIASDVAEEDYAAITWNLFDECNDVVKAQKITSTALNGTKTGPAKYLIGDTWYVELAGVPAGDMHGVKAGDVIDAWVYNGVIVYAKRSSGENATLADVCVVLAKGQNIEGDKVKILKLNSSTTEIVTMDTDPGAGYVTTPKTNLQLGSVYEYSVKDGEYRFKALSTTPDYFGDYTSMNTGDIGVSWSGTTPTFTVAADGNQNMSIAGAANNDKTITKVKTAGNVSGIVSDSAKIVLITNYKGGDGGAVDVGYKIVTGKQFKTLGLTATNADTYEIYENGGIAAFTSKVDGVNRVTYAVVAVEGLKPAFELADNYGYITATDYTAPDGYIVYTVWTGSESVTVQEKNSVPRAKGEIIGYSSIQAKGDNDAFATIKDVSSPKFMVGAATVNDAKDKISLDGSSQLNITSSTKILYIDSANYKGMESGTLRDASTEGGKKLMNVAIIKDGTKDLGLLVYDVTNKLTNITSTLPDDATATDINNALLVGDAELSNDAGITISDDVTIPEGSTLTLNSGSTNNVTLSSGVTMDVTGNLVVDSKFNDGNGTINVAETGTLTLNAAMTSSTVPTITGTGNVVVNANGAVDSGVTFGSIEQNEASATGSANPTPVTVPEGLKLSGDSKVTNFSGSKTLNQLADRTDSETVTPYLLKLLDAKNALDDTKKGTLTGEMLLDNGKKVACIFTGDTTSTDIDGSTIDGTPGGLDTATDLYLSVTIGNRVKSVTYTLTPKDSSAVTSGGTTLKWTFNF